MSGFPKSSQARQQQAGEDDHGDGSPDSAPRAAYQENRPRDHRYHRQPPDDGNRRRQPIAHAEVACSHEAHRRYRPRRGYRAARPDIPCILDIPVFLDIPDIPDIPDISDDPIHQPPHGQQAGREYRRPREEIIIELRQEIPHEPRQSAGPLEVSLDVVPRPEEYLVLLLIEEMVGIPELEECPAADGRQ